MVHSFTYENLVFIKANYDEFIIEPLKENISITNLNIFNEELNDELTKVLIDIDRELENNRVITQAYSTEDII